jgi:hypothetical protein
LTALERHGGGNQNDVSSTGQKRDKQRRHEQ